MMYLDYRVYRDKGRLRKLRIPAFIPFLLLFVLLLINLKTGWLYTIADDATYQIGPLNNLIFVPAAMYFAAAEMLSFKINFRLGALGALIIISRIFWGFISRDISSTSLTYTLFLVCIHLHAMNAPMMEEMTRVALSATWMLNWPSKSVATPMAESLIWTPAPITGSPLASTTLPVTVVCANTCTPMRHASATKMNRFNINNE